MCAFSHSNLYPINIITFSAVVSQVNKTTIKKTKNGNSQILEAHNFKELAHEGIDLPDFQGVPFVFSDCTTLGGENVACVCGWIVWLLWLGRCALPSFPDLSGGLFVWICDSGDACLVFFLISFVCFLYCINQWSFAFKNLSYFLSEVRHCRGYFFLFRGWFWLITY